jgi:galactose mutarotase-like enzyme
LQDHQTLEIRPFNGTFDLSQPEIDAAFKQVNRQSASFSDRQRPLTLNLEYSDLYSTLVFWTLQNKDYICLEPWTAPRNALNTGESLIHLDPQQTIETSVTLRANFL